MPSSFQTPGCPHRRCVIRVWVSQSVRVRGIPEEGSTRSSRNWPRGHGAPTASFGEQSSPPSKAVAVPFADVPTRQQSCERLLRKPQLPPAEQKWRARRWYEWHPPNLVTAHARQKPKLSDWSVQESDRGYGLFRIPLNTEVGQSEPISVSE